jgi:hypothetical protein
MPDIRAMKKKNLIPGLTPIFKIRNPEQIIARQSDRALIAVLTKGFPANFTTAKHII